MATVILGPIAAAEAVCHQEQLEVWSNEIVGLLSMEGWLRDDLSYDEALDLDHAIQREIKRIVESAFDHPEARTIRRVA